jgi:hypothetical protein
MGKTDVKICTIYLVSDIMSSVCEPNSLLSDHQVPDKSWIGNDMEQFLSLYKFLSLIGAIITNVNGKYHVPVHLC